jgi:hypothetical protein
MAGFFDDVVLEDEEDEDGEDAVSEDEEDEVSEDEDDEEDWWEALIERVRQNDPTLTELFHVFAVHGLKALYVE